MLDNKYMGMLLRRARRSANMSLSDCAFGLGVTVAQLRRYESGESKIPHCIMQSLFRWGLAVAVGAKMFAKYYEKNEVGKNALCA